MDVQEITDLNALSIFLASSQSAELLQSQMWGAVQKAEGRRVFFVGIFDEKGALNAVCTVIRHSLPFGMCWLYSPRPVMREDTHWQDVLIFVEKIAKRESALFWKIEGIGEVRNIGNLTRNSKFVIRNSKPLQYRETFIINLSKSEEQLLKNMKPKTRYNIRLAEKKGVYVKWSTDLSDLEIFYPLLKNTAHRQNIVIHSREHYKHILEILGKENAAALIIAFYKHTAIAANLVTFFGDTAVYLHGGADDEYRALMAPYLLQWEAIQEARRRGLQRYDFGGCAVTQGKIKKLRGITRFKSGFGGELHQFGETYNIVFKKWQYRAYYARQKLKNVLS